MSLMKQQFKGKKVSWHENIQLKALLKINGNQNTKEKLAISADGYYECYAVAFSLLCTTNCFSSFNFPYIFHNLTYIGKEEITSKKAVQLQMKFFLLWRKQRAINEDASLLITAFSNARILLSKMIFFLTFFIRKNIELWNKLVEMINWIGYLMEIA